MMTMKALPIKFTPLLILSALASLGLAPSSVTAVDYETEVLAVFKAKCYRCHGDGSAKAGVNLDPDRVAREVGDVIIAGDPESSDLFISVTTDNERNLMPPPGKGQPYTAREIAALREWIEAGAIVPGYEPTDIAKDEPNSPFASRPEPLAGEWTNKDGKTISANLLRVEGENAVLEMAGGRLYNYPIANLSEESQAIVRDFAAKSAESANE
ncbi:MAG: c-type cytochrome domain-containing protein [Verrucomicrobiota bacterium]